MRSLNRLFVALLTLPLVAACVSWTPVAYSPQPARVENPREVALALLRAAQLPTCEYRTSFEGTELRMHVRCQNVGGEGEEVILKTDQLASFRFQTAFGQYRVMFQHRDGTGDFIYGSQNQGDVERFIDAIAQLAPGPIERR